jgi:uncharacterized membrane protein
MDATLSEWINLLVRWFHVMAGILWIGQTWLFTWFEAHFTPPDPPRDNVAGELWMVHSGGFYVVQKQQVPKILPRTLHWFRYEAAFTWLSGLVLLAVVYYGGGILRDERVSSIGEGAAIALGLALLPVSWLVYDALCRSPLGRSETATAAAGFVLLMGVAWGLLHTFSARAAYMHVGAILGTLMVANVWERILPAQRRLVELAREGGAQAPGLAEQAKLRSKHNTFMVVPLLFIMLSSHFPTVSYGHEHAWLRLGLFVLLGGAAARVARGL